MKASEVIERLQELMETYGDQDVYVRGYDLSGQDPRESIVIAAYDKDGRGPRDPGFIEISQFYIH